MRCNRVDCQGADYTDSVIWDNLLSGIYHEEIRPGVLADPQWPTD